MGNRFLLLVVSAVLLLSISQAPHSLTFLRWVALIPLLFIVASKAISSKEKFYYLYSVGVLYLLWQYIWLWHIYPLNWIGIDSIFMSVMFIMIIWVLFSAILATPFFLLGFAKHSVALFPFLWVVVEYLRSWLYSLVTLGPASQLGDYFSYGFLGYSSHTSASLLSITPYLGVYGLSFLIVCVNVVFYLLLRNVKPPLLGVKKKYFASALLVIVLFVVEIIPHNALSQEDYNTRGEIHAVALQGDNPVILGYTGGYFTRITDRYLDSIESALWEYPEAELIVLPESSQFLGILAKERGEDLKKVGVSVLGQDIYRIIVYGDYDYDKNMSIVSAVSNKEGEDPVMVEKNLLMPLGEYQPYILIYGAKLLGGGRWIDNLMAHRSTDTSFRKHQIIETEIGTFSVVSCSEILSFDIYKNIKKADPDLIIHQQRLAPFHGKKRVYKHILAVSQLRAAKLRKPIIGSIDGSGYSYIISPRGEVLIKGDDKSKYIYGEISI